MDDEVYRTPSSKIPDEIYQTPQPMVSKYQCQECPRTLYFISILSLPGPNYVESTITIHLGLTLVISIVKYSLGMTIQHFHSQ